MHLEHARLLLLLGVCSSISATTGCARSDLTPRTSGSADAFQCTIAADPECKLGDVPDISVAIINKSGSDIYLVGSLDASDTRERFPHCYYEIIGPDGESATPEPNKCLYVNALRPVDFMHVPDGQSFDPYQKIDGGFFPAYQLNEATFAKLGKYRIRFYYATNDENLDHWNGIGGQSLAERQQLADLLERVPKLTIASNELTIRVVDPN